MARILKLSIKTGVILTELNSTSGLLLQEIIVSTLRRKRIYRIIEIFGKSNNSKTPNNKKQIPKKALIQFR